MTAKSKNTVTRAFELITSHFQKGISKREAIALSVLFHFMLSIAFAATYWGGESVVPANEPSVKFELVPVDDLEAIKNNYQSNFADLPRNAEAPKKSGKALGIPTSDSKILVADKAKVNKDAVMMASLSSLMELRENFNFVAQQIWADSIGTFTPIQGNAPDTKILSDGLNGYGIGSRTGVITIRGGNGNCPPGGGGILK